ARKSDPPIGVGTVRAKNAREQRQPSAPQAKREKPGACDGNESASVARAARRLSGDAVLATERDRAWRPARRVVVAWSHLAPTTRSRLHSAHSATDTRSSSYGH